MSASSFSFNAWTLVPSFCCSLISVCVTSAMKGTFRSNLSSRSEVMTLIYGDRR